MGAPEPAGPQASAANNLGARLRDLRLARGLSLSELARRAAVGKSTLSQIEAGTRNPTIETIYALLAPLDAPISAVAGRHTVHASGGMASIALDTDHRDGVTIDTHRLEFPEGARHTSPAHGSGVTEHIYVTHGTVQVGPDPGVRLTAGQSHSWRSDTAHGYAAIGGVARAILVITTPDQGMPHP